MIFFKSVNIWRNYKQELRGCLMHFACLANTVLKDEESERDNHVFAGNFAKHSPILIFFHCQKPSFLQIIPTVAFDPFFFRTDYMDSLCLLLLLSISVFTFSVFTLFTARCYAWPCVRPSVRHKSEFY